MTAAHNTLPLNSIVRVVNLKSNQSTVVRITDRGPFVGDRIIDLSAAAAKAVNVYLPGTAKVRLEVLESPRPIETGGRWCVQIGAFDRIRRQTPEKASAAPLPGAAGAPVQRADRILGPHPRGPGRQGKNPRGLRAHPCRRGSGLHGPPRLPGSAGSADCATLAWQGASMSDCLFCKIIAGEIPSKKVYEDEQVFVFEDIKPVAPTHVLIVPKRHFAGLKEAAPSDAGIIGYCHLIAAKLGTRAQHRGRIPHGAQRGPTQRPIGLPPPPAPHRRTRPQVASGLGAGNFADQPLT